MSIFARYQGRYESLQEEEIAVVTVAWTATGVE